MLNLALICALEVGLLHASMCKDESDGANDNLQLFASGRCEDLVVKYGCRRCMP